MALINNIQADILENVARFRFLSTSQLQYLTGKSVSYLRSQLAVLKERKLLKSYQVERATLVKTESVYYITSNCREFLLSNQKAFANDIQLPVGIPLVVRDYFHRLQYVWINIFLYYHLKAQGAHIVSFHSYYDKKGNRRKDNDLEAKTKIALGENMFFVPDGVMITEHNNTQALYLIEMYCDRSKYRVLPSLAQHARAISIGVGKQFGISANPFILCAFEHEGVKQSVMKALQSNDRFKNVSKFFFFASLDDIRKNVGTAWKSIAGNQIVFTNNSS